MASSNLPELVTTQAHSKPKGQRLITAHACYYPPAVKSADLLLVDFDTLDIQHEGLYLVEESRNSVVIWIGCRRFDRRPGKLLMDIDGEGDWQPIDLDAVGWRIAGTVRQVFKPSI